MSSSFMRCRTIARNATIWARPSQQRAVAISRCFTSSDPPLGASGNQPVAPPTKAQLNAVRLQAALPMIGFGFMDQTIMIHAGNAIDCTIGVSLGISTLAAAAVGQIVANAGGILFGTTLERFFSQFLWIPQTNLTASQLSLAVVEKSRFSGTFWGLIAGCILGLGNLLCIDSQWAEDKKLNHSLLADCSSFEIQVSSKDSLSTKHQPATTLTICGPDVDGMLAIVLTALKEEGYSILEMSAKPKKSQGSKVPLIEDIFVVRRKGQAIPEEELARLTQKLVEEKLLPATNRKHTLKLEE